MLSAPHKRFGILGAIAKLRCLKIASFPNAHRTFNCECGITDNDSKKAFIFIYHLREPLPAQLLKPLPPYFEKHIQFLTDDYFKTLHWQR